MSHRHLPSTFINTVLKNGVGRYICQLQRLTLKFCKSHADSYGIRSFIENDLLEFVRKNPGTVVYLQPRRHHKPQLVGEYWNRGLPNLLCTGVWSSLSEDVNKLNNGKNEKKVNGRRENMIVNNYSRDEICQWVELMRTRSGDKIVRLRKPWHTDTPSVQGIWTPYTNSNPEHNLRTFPSEELSAFKPAEPTATERLLEMAAELRSMDNVVVEEERH